MENEVQPNDPLVQPSSPNHAPVTSPSNVFKVFSFTILGLAIVAGSVLVGIQIGRNQVSSQQQIAAQPAPSPTQTTVVPTTPPVSPTQVEILPSVPPTPKIDPAKIIEDVKNFYVSYPKSKDITTENTVFEWRDEKSENEQLQCSSQPTTITGSKFHAKGVSLSKELDLTKLGYPNAKISNCNIGDGTLRGQTGYIIGNIVCIFETQSETYDGPSAITFSCGIR